MVSPPAPGSPGPLRTTPKDGSGFSPADTEYGTSLAVPVKFLEAQDLPPADFLQHIDSPNTGFSVPVPHHTRPAPV